MVFGVATASPYTNGRELLAALKKHPESFAVGVGSSIAGANAVAMGLVAHAAGGDRRKLKIVAFKTAADSVTAMMGGHINLVATSAGVMLSGIKNGQVRALAVAAPRRLTGEMANVPTWKELGADVAVGNWRIALAPPGLSRGQAEFWDQVMAKVVAAPAWLESLERYSAVPEYMDSQTTRRFLEQQETLFREAFAELGIAKK